MQKLFRVSAFHFHRDRRRCCCWCCFNIVIFHHQLDKLVKMATATDDSVINHRLCFPHFCHFGKPSSIFIGSFIFVCFSQSQSQSKSHFIIPPLSNRSRSISVNSIFRVKSGSPSRLLKLFANCLFCCQSFCLAQLEIYCC